MEAHASSKESKENWLGNILHRVAYYHGEVGVSPILESAVERKASDYAESIGYISLKINVVAQRGWPDHLYINRHGHHIWVEFKKLGEKPSKIQRHRLMELVQQDAEAHWADNYNEAKEILDAGVDTARLPA